MIGVTGRRGWLISQVPITPASAASVRLRRIGHLQTGLTDASGAVRSTRFWRMARQRRGDRDLGSPPELRAYCEEEGGGHGYRATRLSEPTDLSRLAGERGHGEHGG